MVGIEARRAARSLVADLLTLFQRRGTLRERVNDRRTRNPVADLLDVWLERGRGGRGGGYTRQRRQVDPVVEMHGARSRQIGGEIPGAADLALLGVDRRRERSERRAAGLDDE